MAFNCPMHDCDGGDCEDDEARPRQAWPQPLPWPWPRPLVLCLSLALALALKILHKRPSPV